MSRYTIFPLPRTTHVVTAKDLINAASGKPFVKTDYFYTIPRKKLKDPLIYMDIAFRLDLNDEDDDDDDMEDDEDDHICVVVINSTILLDPHLKSLVLHNTEEVSFVFYKCVLPEIVLEECTGFDWLLYGTHIVGSLTLFHLSYLRNIFIDEGSLCTKIIIDDHSQCMGISLSNTKRDFEIVVQNNSHIYGINIDDNSQCGSIRVLQNSKSGQIYLRNNSECPLMHIQDGSEAGLLSVFGGSKFGNLWVVKSSYIQGVDITNSQCEHIFVQENSRSGTIRVEDTGSCEKILISKDSMCSGISLAKESKCEVINVNDNSHCATLHVYDSKVNEVRINDNTGSLYLHNANIPLLRLQNCLLHELAWQAGSRGDLYVEGGSINHLKLIKTSLLKDAVFSIIRARIYIVQMQELLVQGQLVLRNIQAAEKPFDWDAAINNIKKEKVEDRVNKKRAALYNEKLKLLEWETGEYKRGIENIEKGFKNYKSAVFRIVDSSLGKTEITGSDLENFHFEYRDSKLLETFFSGTKLPKDKIKIYNIDAAQFPIAYYEQKVSFYNQLKRIYDNQGDIVEATWYHSKAMDNQERLLKERYKGDGGCWFGEQWFDLLTFRLNKYTNNHGESWRKALRFIFFISLGIYCLYYLSLHYKEAFSFQATDRFVSNYFQFLDLTHKIDFHVEKKLLWWLPVLVDLSGRILIGYGIYQFIAAFRRHGRKGG